jgi:hypothetical protein
MCSVSTPAQTPGTFGLNDQADPTIAALLGNTPGPLGLGDYADPDLLVCRIPRTELLVCRVPPVEVCVQPGTGQRLPVAKGDKGRDGPKPHLSIGGVVVAGRSAFRRHDRRGQCGRGKDAQGIPAVCRVRD